MTHIALLQVASPDEEPAAERLARVDAAVRSEKELRGADLLVLPEMWGAGYFSFEKYTARAEPFEGATMATARRWAQTLALRIHLGSFVEIDSSGHLYNTSVVIGPDGDVENVYRKIHVFGYGSREQELLTPGEKVQVSDVSGVPTGITTCYDLRFPELYRSLVDQGAQQVLVCAAWPAARLAHWRLFTSVRAVEQQCLLVACNAVGEQGGVRLGGHSRIIDPWGEVVIEAGDLEGFTYAAVDPEMPATVRAEFPALADRRWTYATP